MRFMISKMAGRRGGAHGEPRMAAARAVEERNLSIALHQSDPIRIKINTNDIQLQSPSFILTVLGRSDN